MRWFIFGHTWDDLRWRLNHAEAAALGTEHSGAPWPCHTNSPDLWFALARTTQSQVFFIVRYQDSAGNSPRGITGNGDHQEMTRDGIQVPTFSTIDDMFQGLEEVGKWPNRCGVKSSSPTWGHRGPKCRRVAVQRVGQKLVYDLNLCEIQVRGDSICWAFQSPMCAGRIWSRSYPKSEFKLAFGYDSEENPRWGSFSFGSISEGSRGTMTRLVGPPWVDFRQTGAGNGEASGLHTLKS
jgi:hypothetical protein